MARKYLTFDKTQPFISVTAILAFLGVMIGVAVLILAMAIMNGFDKDFQKKLFTMNYPLTIQAGIYGTVDRSLLEKLETRFPELKFSPFLRTQGIAKRGGMMDGLMVFGVDFEKEKPLNEVFAKAAGEKAFPRFSAIAGKSLMDDMMLDIGAKMMVVFTQSEPVGIATSPLMKRFRIESVFESGLTAYDKAYFYVDLKDLQTILRVPEEEFHGIHVYAEEPMKVIDTLRSQLPPGVSIMGWWEQNGNFFAALELEKRALFIVLMLIILVASLNIITSLLMTVMNRRKEIALLLSLGASKGEIRKIFFIIGSVIGVSGILFGALLGGAGLWILSSFDLITLPADVYGTSRLPVELSAADFFSVVFGALAIVLFSSFYPAKKASEIEVLTVLRHE